MKRKIYFICPTTKAPIGGIKQLYRQVDILNRNGFNAVILHNKRNFRHKWFENNTKIEYNAPLFMQIRWGVKKHALSGLTKVFNKLTFAIQSIFASKLDNNAILVFPEIFSLSIEKIKTNAPAVIFNQNCYYTFLYNSIDNKAEENPYDNTNIIATIVVSNDSKNYLSFAVPGIEMHRIRLGIDQSKFYYNPNKKKQIAFMPRKLEEDITQVINILKLRDSLKDWTLVCIDNKNEQEVAQIMRESHIFLSFNHIEGFGLPPAEAMACGCIVIGYTGRAGDEYFNTDFSYPVEDRNIIDFAKKIEDVMLLFDNNKEVFIEKQKKASQYILDQYNLLNEEQDIVTIWNTILNSNS